MSAVALGGTSAPSWLARAVAFKRVALGLDADAACDRGPVLAAQLGSLGAVVERWRPVGVKDWNDALCAYGAAARGRPRVSWLSRGGWSAARGLRTSIGYALTGR